LQDNVQDRVHHGDLIVREQGALHRITLHRPKALNALTLDMAVTIKGFVQVNQNLVVTSNLSDGGVRASARRPRSKRCSSISHTRRY
jgi:hypothetical protein